MLDVGVDTAPGIEASGDSHDEAHHDVARVAIVVYAIITTLGVVAAVTLKEFAKAEDEVIVSLVGASLAISVAHVWSTLMAHRLVHRTAPSRDLVNRELQVLGSYFVVTLMCVLIITAGVALGMTFEGTVVLTEVVLIACLFGLGMVGARGAGAGWARSLGWGALDSSIGAAIILVKLLAGG